MNTSGTSGYYYKLDDHTFKTTNQLEERDSGSEYDYIYDEKPIIYTTPITNANFETMKDFYVLIDSGNRNLLYEHLFSFRVNFTASSTTLENQPVQTILNANQPNNPTDDVMTTTTDGGKNPTTTFIGNDNTCSTFKRYCNVSNIYCTKIMMPNYEFLRKYVINKDIIIDKFNIQNVMYLSINELQNALDGTNTGIFNAYQIFIPSQATNSEVIQLDKLYLTTAYYTPVNEIPEYTTPINLRSMTVNVAFNNFSKEEEFNQTSPDLYDLAGISFEAPKQTFINSQGKIAGGQFHFYFRNPVPLTWIKIGQLMSFLTKPSPLNDQLIILNGYFSIGSQYVVVNTLTLEDTIIGFSIASPKLTPSDIETLKEKLTSPYPFLNFKIYALNLSLQYQMLFKLKIQTPMLQTGIYPKSK